jgi:hypothetical protein
MICISRSRVRLLQPAPKIDYKPITYIDIENASHNRRFSCPHHVRTPKRLLGASPDLKPLSFWGGNARSHHGTARRGLPGGGGRRGLANERNGNRKSNAYPHSL